MTPPKKQALTLQIGADLTHSIYAVIFDCDGTLVDSEVPSMDVIHEQASALGVVFTREQAHKRFRGVRMADCIAWIAAQLPQVPHGFAEDFARTVRAAQAQRFAKKLDVIPGAFELLGTLQIPFCVATNGPREKVELTLGLTGLRPFFPQHIFSAYEVGVYKPDPGLFLHAARVLGVAPEHCAVVEDSLPGIVAGLAAGMRVFSLLPRSELPVALVERVVCIRNLVDLRVIFQLKD
jgi:HAD superfamily hydrolase (TIGR01509 family)